MYIKSFGILVVLFLYSGVLLYGQDYSSERSTEIISESGQKFYQHTVTKGNTIYNLSKTYGVSKDVITKYNPQVKEGLSLGMVLKIPLKKTKTNDFIYHIVKKKETLFQIANIYNVSVEDIKAANQLKGETISKGQYLKIPSFASIAPAPSESNQTAEPKSNLDEKKYAYYTVQPKETLFTISKRFGLSIDALMYLNDLNSIDIKTGQKLLIPRVLVENQRNIKTDTAKFVQHKVMPKETLYGIAREYAVSIEVIKAVNKLEEKQIQIGQILNIPRVLNTSAYIEHRVYKRREKLKQIAGEYNVSVSALKKANPSVPSKLKKGESLLIPVGFIETDFAKDQVIELELPGTVVDEVKEIKPECEQDINYNAKYKVAFMLPLYLEEVDSLMTLSYAELLENKTSKPFKYIEYLEGAYMAVDELQEQGLELEFQIYDVTHDIEKTNKVLSNPKLKEVDLIISLVYSKNFELISDYSKKYHIPLVNTLSKRRKIIYENPYVFKVEPNKGDMYREISEYILEKYSSSNIIVVRNNPYQLANEYTDLKNSLVRALPDFVQIDSMMYQNTLHTVIYSVDSLSGIVKASSNLRNNLIVAFGLEEVFAIELFTKLNFIGDSLDYQVIGLPDWSGFTGVDIAYSQPLALHTATNNYVDYGQEHVKNFVLKYRENYGIEPQMNRYSFLGYDVTKYFLSALMKYGKSFPDCIEHNNVNLLENQLNFRKNSGTGYENINWNIIQQKDYRYQLVK